MAYRNKTFVSFDGDHDIHYYRLMTAWNSNDAFEFNFYNAHDLNVARDTSQQRTIKRKLHERLKNAKLVISLIGAHTRFLYTFVRWELEQAVNLRIPIVGVNLNGLRYRDDDRCPPVIRNELVLYVPFKANIIQHAIVNWPSQYESLQKEGKSGPYFYNNSVYENLGIVE